VLVVHRAESGAVLARALAEVLTEPPADPFAGELVAVPAKGVERWLAQRLAHVLGAGPAGDGVCAAVQFPWPATLVDEAVRAASPEHDESVERWHPARATWPLLSVLDESLDQPWCRSLARHLAPAHRDGGRRFAVASRLAGFFDAYGQARPQMLRDWASGRDEQGDGTPLDADLLWQAELWRALRRRLDVPAPAELLDAACERLRVDPALTQLPQRFSVFGASRLSPARLAVLAALAEHRDVHLWLHHPSPALWRAAARAGDVVRRADDTTARDLTNPLLTSMARDLVELQHLLRRNAPAARDVHHLSEPNSADLLGRLKDDLAQDRLPDDPPPLDVADRSVQVHACHGRTRQVEVLREVVLGLLDADPTLEPRDVLVMCPDVEAFAPLVAAAFSLGSPDDADHPAARLRVRLADRALRQTNPLLDVLSQLLELGTSRLSAPQVLDLAGRVAVRRRFGFDDDDLERLRAWVVGAGVRWGLDAGHREAWSLGDLGQGTWRAGLDRLLLGAAVQDSVTGAVGVGDVIAVDDVDSADIDLLGRFAELVDRVDAAQSLLSGRHTPSAWAGGLLDAVLSLAAPGPADAWQQAQLTQELAQLAEAADGTAVELALADVRGALSAALAGRPTRAGFRTGTLTVCTLVPMRSVPHRVVCLLGLDDGAFPRQNARDGDDVLARDPWVGERDTRSEDRQLLLDAVSAAQEHLVIAYSGADERTGARIAPSVPLGELLDAIDRTASVPGGRVRDAITTLHPLQPFDSRNFTHGALGTPGPFSFDRLALAGARAGTQTRTEVPGFLAGPLPATVSGSVELLDLRRLLLHPARGFLRQRLDVAATWAEQEPGDALPIELDGLEKWSVGERVLLQRLSGLEPADVLAVELRRGLLPPGPLGHRVLREVGQQVDAIVGACSAERQVPPESHDIDVDLLDGTSLTGTVAGVHGDVVLSTTYSSLGAKHRLTAWIDLVALTAAFPGRPWTAVAVGRERAGARRSVLGPLRPHEAQDAVRELVALYRSGLAHPLPLPLKTASAYAARRERGDTVDDSRLAAEREWLGGTFDGEQSDAEHELVHGLLPPLTVLTAQRPWPQESGPGWADDEDDRFGRLARRLWSRLLAAESVARG
jgi:exodeoxyribonuclease V gamma subunit